MADETTVQDKPQDDEPEVQPVEPYTIADQHSGVEELDEGSWPGQDDAGDGETAAAAQEPEQETDDTETPEPDESAAEPEADPELVTFAQELGWADEYIEKLGKAGLLEQTLHAALYRDGKPEEGEEPAAKPDAAAKPKPKVDSDEDEESDGETEAEFDLSASDPDLVKAFQSQTTELQETRQTLNNLVQVVMAERELQHEQAFDRRIEELGDDWKEMLGSGPGTKLDKKSDIFSNRQKLYQAEEDVADMLQRRGVNVTPEELTRRALVVAFGDRSAQLTRKKIAQATKKATRGRALPRPSGRKGSDAEGMTVEQQAYENLKKKMEAKGMDTSNSGLEPEELEDLP